MEDLTRRIRELEEALAAQSLSGERLRASEEKYRLLFDEAPLAYQMLTAAGVLREVNDAWLALLGQERKDVLGRRFEDFLAPEFKVHFREIFSCFIADGAVRGEEFELMRKDGLRVPVLFEGRISAGGGSAERLTRCILQDITERKEAEERTRRQNEFLHTIIDSIPSPFYVIDSADYSIVMANAAAAAFGETAGATCHALTHKTDIPCPGGNDLCPLAEVIKTRGPVLVEHVHYDREGRPRHYEVHGYPVFDGRGEIVQMIEYAMEITQRKELEKERTDLIASLQEALAKVKTLSGLLPICSSCKKIRDDQGYWRQLEAYIQLHSDAAFTHGLCPECLKSWFPDLPRREENPP